MKQLLQTYIAINTLTLAYRHWQVLVVHTDAQGPSIKDVRTVGGGRGAMSKWTRDRRVFKLQWDIHKLHHYTNLCDTIYSCLTLPFQEMADVRLTSKKKNA